MREDGRRLRSLWQEPQLLSVASQGTALRRCVGSVKTKKMRLEYRHRAGLAFVHVPRLRTFDPRITPPLWLALSSHAQDVEVYVAHKLMPQDRAGDALHLALASHYGCDILLTWNCVHLANANKFRHIQRVNALLGLSVPVLSTPLQLMEDDHDS